MTEKIIDTTHVWLDVRAVASLKNHTRADAKIAKNYLNADELNILNRIVTAYLEFAELQALRKQPMYMKDWITKLDDFIKMSGSELLQNAGKICQLEAENKALKEYAKYKEKTKNELFEVEIHFIESIKETQKKLEGKKSDKGLSF